MQASSDSNPLRPEPRKAALYRRRDLILVVRVDTTVDGIPFTTDEVYAFQPPFAEADLGRTLRRVLAAARSSLPPVSQDQWRTGFQPVLRAAGVRSWSAFVRGCRDVSVSEADGLIRFRPTVNLGAADGFEASPSGTITIPLTDDEAVGRYALKALDLAQDGPRSA